MLPKDDPEEQLQELDDVLPADDEEDIVVNQNRKGKAYTLFIPKD